jgi:hypothetical protein
LILKGNQRGGGQQLAAHLMNSFDNESVEIADVRGAVAQDLSGAFAEWSAQGRATKIEKKYYYSLSLSPDPAQGRLTREQYFDLIARTERSLELVGQPRAVVFHVKEGREHGHVVWSRVNTRGDKVKAVDIAHDRLKLRTVTQEFCREHGLKLPERMMPGRSRKSRVNVFKDRAENHGERQQKERSGIPRDERKSVIARCWSETRNGDAFVHAMQVKGYYLARGDKRDYVVLDLYGDVHSLSKQLSGVVRKKELEKRLAGYPPDKQPGVEKVKEFLAQKRKDAIRKAVAQKEAGPTELEVRRQALQELQQKRRADLDHIKDNLIARHADEREVLKAAQQAQNTGIASARLQKQPKGFIAFLTRITGIKMLTEARQKLQDKARAAEHKQQTDALQRTHGREQHDLDRRYRTLDRLETRENRSVETALKREQFQIHVLKKPSQRVVQPEFNRAAGVREATGNAGSGGLSAKFRHHAEDSGVRRGELKAAFERATSGKTKAAGDAGEGGPAPPEKENLDEARRLRDELQRRQPRPGPNRERDRER